MVGETSAISDSQPESHPTVTLVDNQGVVKQATKFANHASAKHYRIEQAVIRERTQTGDMKITYVRSEDNPADFFTKALSKSQFLRHKRTLMGQQTMPTD